MNETPAPGAVRLLVPLDGSELAESVLPVVAGLAARLHPAITLLHLIERNAPAKRHGERHLTKVAEAEAYLAGHAAALTAAGASVATHVHDVPLDDVAQSIVDHAEESDTGYIVLCAHGRGGLRDLLFGSIAQQVLLRGDRPVLMLPAGSRTSHGFTPQRILVPLDGSAVHEAALVPAALLAKAFGSRLHLLYVVPTLHSLEGDRAPSAVLAPATTRAMLDLAAEGAGQYLERVAAEQREAGLEVDATTSRGHAVVEISELAEKLPADLVVVASHARAGLDALLTGSVGPRLLGRIGCPVLLIRAPAGSPTAG